MRARSLGQARVPLVVLLPALVACATPGRAEFPSTPEALGDARRVARPPLPALGSPEKAGPWWVGSSSNRAGTRIEELAVFPVAGGPARFRHRRLP